MSRYCIDIDGVISTKLEWTVGDSYLRAKEMFAAIGENRDVIARINQLHKEGHTIVLHTSRIWHDYKVTVEWLKAHAVEYDCLIMAKPLADFYVDDKNLSVEEFLKL